MKLKNPAEDMPRLTISTQDQNRGSTRTQPDYFGTSPEVPFFFRADEEEERAIAELEREGL